MTIAALSLACGSAAAGSPESDFNALLKQREAGNYQPPTVEAVVIAGELYARTLEQGLTDQLRDDWQQAGFNLAPFSRAGLQLSKADGKRDGRGVYLINPDARRRVMIQAPHRGYDRLTGKIAFRMFAEGDFMAAGWNSLHRYVGVGSDREGGDLARTAGSYWMGISDAFLSSSVDALILQLHGFNPNRRDSPAAKTADMIVSSGTRPASRLAGDFAACLKRRWPGEVLLYPRDVSELGGTRNPLSRLEQNTGRHRFLHLEMSPSTRRRLTDEPSMRRILRDCLP